MIKSKRTAIAGIILTLMLMSSLVVLTGCGDREDNMPPYTQPIEQPSRERDPNAPLPPLPPRNPDGTLG